MQSRFSLATVAVLWVSVEFLGSFGDHKHHSICDSVICEQQRSLNEAVHLVCS